MFPYFFSDHQGFFEICYDISMIEIMKSLGTEDSSHLTRQQKDLAMRRAKEFVLQSCQQEGSKNLPDYPFRGPCRVMDCRGTEFMHNKTCYGKGGQVGQALEHVFVAAMSPLKGRRIALLCRNPVIADSIRERIEKANTTETTLKPEGSSREKGIQELQGLNVKVMGPIVPNAQIVICGWNTDYPEQPGFSPTAGHVNFN